MDIDRTLCPTVAVGVHVDHLLPVAVGVPLDQLFSCYFFQWPWQGSLDAVLADPAAGAFAAVGVGVITACQLLEPLLLLGLQVEPLLALLLWMLENILALTWPSKHRPQVQESCFQHRPFLILKDESEEIVGDFLQLHS